MTTMRTSGVDWAGLIKSLKDSKRWTSAMLAERIGASTASIGVWVSGRGNPGAEFAARLTALAEGKRVSLPKTTAGAGRPAGRRLQAVQPTPASSTPTTPEVPEDAEDDAGSAPLADDPDPVHAAIMSDHTLTDTQRTAVASLRLAFQEMAR